MSSIPLEPGDNPLHPRLTTCPICGDEGTGLVIGAIRKVELNGKWYYAQVGSAHKVKKELIGAGLMHYGESLHWEKLEENEKVPDSEPCKKCQDQISIEHEVIKAGGIYFKCSKCGIHGVIKAGADVSKGVREHSGIKAPNPVGIDFDGCDKDTYLLGLDVCPLAEEITKQKDSHDN